MSRRKVDRVWLQSPIDVAGLPGATTQISPDKCPGAVSFLTDLGLEVSKGTIRAFIPIANVKVAIFSNEPNTEAQSE